MRFHSEFLELSEVEESLLSFFIDMVCIYFPFEIIADMSAEEFE